MTAAAAAVADLERAVAALGSARRPLVTGLVGADAEAAIAACDLAEAVGAAVDPGSPETSRIVGPLVARIGAITAAPEELRDRADLVVLWFCDPETSAPGFIESYVVPAVNAAPRRTIAVGPRDVPVVGTDHRHIALPDDALVDGTRLVEAMVRGIAIDDAARNAAAVALTRALAEALATARTVAIVTDWRRDAVGLAAWSTASLVRTLAHAKPAFEVPLGDRDDAAMAVCTWRYGAPGAIERGDRNGGRFLAAEADAMRLIDRRETDCVMLVGEPTGDVIAAIDRAGDGLTVVRLPADAAALRQLVDRLRATKESVA